MIPFFRTFFFSGEKKKVREKEKPKKEYGFRHTPLYFW